MAFGVSGTEDFFAIKQVTIDLFGGNLVGCRIGVILEQEPDFARVIKQGRTAVMADFKNELQLLQGRYSSGVDGFFSMIEAIKW
jgi:hypothetical protein